MEERQCNKCNATFDENMAYCPYCGTKYNENAANEPNIVSTGRYFALLIGMLLPVIGIVITILLLIVGENRNIKNFAKAFLILHMILIVICVIAVIIAIIVAVKMASGLLDGGILQPIFDLFKTYNSL